MARVEVDPNYANPTFPRATAPTDLFKKEDVQSLAAAVSTHNHSAGRGVLLTAGAFPDGLISESKLANGAVTTPKIADGNVTGPKLANGIIDSSKMAPGPLTLASGLQANYVGSTTYVAATTWLAAGPVLSGGAGDISANRGNNTGYLFLANASHYVGFDGANYQMPSSELYVNGAQVATSNNSMALANKQLTSPVLAGTVQGTPAWASPQYFPPGTFIGSYQRWPGYGITFDYVQADTNYTLPHVMDTRILMIFIRAGQPNVRIFSSTGDGSFWVGQANYATTGYLLQDGNGIIIVGYDRNWYAISKTMNPTW